MGATVPVRPTRVDANGLAWTFRGRWWWASEFAGGFYHVTFNERTKDGWDVLHSDGRGPFREVVGADAEMVVAGLRAWIVAGGGELPA